MAVWAPSAVGFSHHWIVLRVGPGAVPSGSPNWYAWSLAARRPDRGWPSGAVAHRLEVAEDLQERAVLHPRSIRGVIRSDPSASRSSSPASIMS